MLLAGRVRKPEEEAVILSILAKNFKRTVNPEELFSQKQLTSQFSECCCTLDVSRFNFHLFNLD